MAQSALKANREFINITNATIVRMNEGVVKVHAFKPTQYVVSSYIIELPTKLVLIDFQINLADSGNLLNYALSLNKGIEMGILTHYHFDHWLGVKTLTDANIPIFALNETINQLREFYVNGVANPFQTAASDLLNFIRPISLGSRFIDGVQFSFEKVVGGENPFTLITRLPAFSVISVGDLVGNQVHAYLPEVTDFKEWLSVLDLFLQKYPYRNILVGHGDPSAPEQIKQTIEYLTYVRDIANTFKTLDGYRASILKRYPNFPNTPIINCAFSGFNCIRGNFS